jgi:ribosomal protein S18 acetylase RimI-like enzyme
LKSRFLVWDKSDIKSITPHQKEMWFDFYNNDLFEDRGYDITFMDVDDVNKLYEQFKQDYFDYLDSLKENDEFVCYVVYEMDDMFVSQARIMLKENRYYIEGLETHRELYRKGYGSTLIKYLEEEASKRGIKELYANAYNQNIPSIETFLSLGYKEVKTEVKNRICMKKDL